MDGSAFLDKAVEFMISRMGPIFALTLAATLTIAAFKFDGFASGEVRADDFTIAGSALVTAILVLSELNWALGWRATAKIKGEMLLLNKQELLEFKSKAVFDLAACLVGNIVLLWA